MQSSVTLPDRLLHHKGGKQGILRLNGKEGLCAVYWNTIRREEKRMGTNILWSSATSFPFFRFHRSLSSDKRPTLIWRMLAESSRKEA
jgi:hypothetical protein